MNIIKFKDIDCPSELNGKEISEADRELFNKYFKGRYCYAIHMWKIYLMIPEDSELNNGIKPSEYEKYEHGNWYESTKGKNADGTNVTPILLYNDYKSLIDNRNIYTPTPEAGSEFFMTLNRKYEDIRDINMNDVYNYRQRVANYIFSYGKAKDSDNNYALGFLDVSNTKEFCPKKLEMLKYYSEGMTSDTIEMIKLFQDAMSSKIVTNTSSGCGCGSNNNFAYTSPSSLSTTPSCTCQSNTGVTNLSAVLNSIGSCNIYQTYRKMMKAYMIETFSDVKFWLEIASNRVSRTALIRIITLTEQLIKSGISIFSNNTTFDLNYPCGISSSDARYDEFVQDMNNFIEALNLILESGASGGPITRLSFVNNALASFASYYEYLQWSGYTVNIFDTDENYE